MVQLLLLAVVAVAATASPYTFDPALNDQWGSFKKVHSKVYSPSEEQYRRMIFENNMNFIRDHNMQADLGFESFRVGVNEYADLTNEEFVRLLTGYIPSNSTDGAVFLPPSNVEIPKTVDWRKEGYVTPVKNQKQCGSCWAFSATGALEGQHFKKTKKLVSLSEQNLVDCSREEGNLGCAGGLQTYAYEYIKKNHGIDTEESYPYKAKDEKCRFKRMDVGATCTGYVHIPRHNETALEHATATVGPIAVGIDASHMSFQLYKTGVYHERKCSQVKLDHGVLVVGYGTIHGKAYWLVKNSWGKSWGEDGYIMMSRNKRNNCGIATAAVYPLV